MDKQRNQRRWRSKGNLSFKRFALWGVLPTLVPALLAGAANAAGTGGGAAAATRPRIAVSRGAGRIGAAPSLASNRLQLLLKIAPPGDFGFLNRPMQRASASSRNAAVNTLPAATPTSASPERTVGYPSISTAAALPAAAAAHPAAASTGVTLDSTLVPARPVPISNNAFAITPDLGKQSGDNLFYSFGAFGLSTGQTANFTGTPFKPVQNVFVRVTGGQASTIDGTLACTYPNANFFLMNPAGITFTTNASLNLQGSFAVSTADYIRFSDNTRFTATNPGSSSTLSSAAPAAFGFVAASPAGLTVNGAFLQPPDGNVLLAVAGPIQLNGGVLFCSSGKMGVASIASTGEVAFDSKSLAVTGITNPTLGDITLTADGAIVADSNPNGAASAGSITLTAGSLQVLYGAYISSSNNGAGGGGQVGVIVGGPVMFAGADTKGFPSAILAQGAIGDAGSITLTAESLMVLGGAQISAQTVGSGNGGTINANIAGAAMLGSADAQSGPFGIAVDSRGKGKAGNVTLNAGSLQVLGGAQISAQTAGSGNGGTITANVAGAAILGGADTNGSPSGITTASQMTSTGNAGNVTLNAGSLQLLGGAQITASTASPGQGGTIVVNVAGSAVLSGEAATVSPSGIVANSLLGTGGNAGSITLSAGSLQLLGGAQIASQTVGQGKGGDIIVKVAGPATLSGTELEGSPSGITANTYAVGNAGSISFSADSLQVLGGAQITSSTFGVGAGADITAQVAGLTLVSGTTAKGSPSGIAANSVGSGDGGAIKLTTGSLQLLNGGQVTSQAASLGEGGGIAVDVTGLAMLSGETAKGSPSGIVTNSVAGADGSAGTITLNAGSLQITGGAGVTSSTLSQGNAGDVTVNVSGLAMLSEADATGHGSYIAAVSNKGASGSAGSVVFTAGSLALDGGAFVSSTTNGTGGGGSVNVQVAGQAVIQDNSLISANSSFTGAGGNAGQVTLTAAGLQLSTGGSISSSNAGSNIAGDVTVDVKNALSIAHGGSVRANAPKAHGGNILLLGDSFSLSGQASQVTTLSSEGGSITVNARHGDLRMGSHALISAETTRGEGGNITLDASGLLWIDSSIVTARAAGNGGKISIDPQYVLLEHSTIDGRANGQDVKVAIGQAAVFVHSGDSQILSNNVSLPPETDVSEQLLALPSALPQASLSLAPACAQHLATDFSSFIITGNGGEELDAGAWTPDLTIFAPGRAKDGRP